MRFVDDSLIQKWADNSIPRGAKNEVITAFHAHFGYSEQSNMFGWLMSKKRQPTPDQHRYIAEKVQEYWDFYNPKVAEESLLPLVSTVGK